MSVRWLRESIIIEACEATDKRVLGVLGGLKLTPYLCDLHPAQVSQDRVLAAEKSTGYE